MKGSNKEGEPCKVCGSTDLNLIDGYYYCVECGTQNANVQETIVEKKFFADGSTAFVWTKKYATFVKDGIEMSGEWYKWHAYNFILAGLTEELIKLGAKPTVKLKVLWIWIRYIKMFQDKEDLGNKSKIGDNHPSFYVAPPTPAGSDNSESEEDIVIKKKGQFGKFHKGLTMFTKGLLLAILYLALNFDKSHIQLSHLIRFIKEGRLSLFSCSKYIPKEIDTNKIPHWSSFLRCQSEYNSHTIRSYAMACIKTLDLGFPVVPDFNKIIDTYIKELCLPNDFKDLVISLMLYYPSTNIDVNEISLRTMTRIPDYENVAMSYVLVAFKMCFGLDGDYEIQQSEIIDGINEKENYLKSHKLGMCSEPSDRLFSFKEWTSFLQLRKTMLCQYYLPIAIQHNEEVDDYVLMEHLQERGARPLQLRDEVTMDILNKIPCQKKIHYIPKTEFASCLTPMSNYTDVIVKYINDNKIRLLLSEDFTQYSLKYASKCSIIDGMEDIQNYIISKKNKIIKLIEGNFKSKQGDVSMVFVRNCENKNWLKTNPPTVTHITKINSNESNDRDSDQEYDSVYDNSSTSKVEDMNDNEEVKLEYFEEESEHLNIYDDHFKNDDDKSYLGSIYNTGLNEFNNENFNNNSDYGSDELKGFDPNNFDRTKLINELIAKACVKYKIPMPRQYVPTKRGNKPVNTEVGESAPKRSRTKKSTDSQMQVKDVISAYYLRAENDILTKLSEQLRNAIHTQNSHCENVINNSFQLMQAEEGTANNVSPESNINFEQSDNHHDLSITNRSLRSNDVDNTHHGIDSMFEPDADENENEDLESYGKVEDPNFDSKTHNIKQLYVKLNEESGINDCIDIKKDPELEQIVIDKLGKVYSGDGTNNKETDDEDEDEDEDVDEDECYERCNLEQAREKNSKRFKPLINRQLKIKKIEYWLRHYERIHKNLDIHQKFDAELNDNYPASFILVIRECAAILNSTTFSLYKVMQNLETEIMKEST